MSKIIFGIAIFIAGIAVGALFLGDTHDDSAITASSSETALEHALKHTDPEYVCPMHPQITDTQQSSCPICGMDLELREQPDQADTGDGVTVSAAMRNSLGVRVVHVDRGPVAEEVYASGFVERVSASQTRDLVSKVNGDAIEFHVKEGQWLEQGDVIATIKYAPFRETLKKYLEAMRAVKIDEALAYRQQLVDMGASEFVLAASQDERKLPENLEIAAPFSGEVHSLAVKDGTISIGDKIATVSAPSLAEVDLRSYSRVARGVEVGHKGRLEVAHLPGRSWYGRVVEVIHNRTGFYSTLRFHVEVPAGVLEPGAFAGAFVNAGFKDDVLRVPASSIIYDEGRIRVIVLNDDDTFKAVDVVTGYEGHEWVEILSGVEEGEHVVTRGQFLIDSEATLQAGLQRFEK